ncbi:MAG: twin-arginine translocation signal domain-containing protein, partial [Actinomycetota bacterium]
MKKLSRRDFVKGVGAGAALMLAAPRLALGMRRGTGPGALRASQLMPGSGEFVVHSDLHNHSLISGDAFGDPATAYAQMRARGIDVACVTEHAISGKGHGELTCPGHEEGGCHKIEGINETDWGYMRELADAANDP